MNWNCTPPFVSALASFFIRSTLALNVYLPGVITPAEYSVAPPCIIWLNFVNVPPAVVVSTTNAPFLSIVISPASTVQPSQFAPPNVGL